MNHLQIEESNTVDRYLLGRLPAEEQSQFEEHFVDCQECLDRLETSASFRRGVKTVVAEDALRTGAYVQAGVLAWLMRRNRWQQTVLLLIAIFLLVGPSAFFIMKNRRVQEELDGARRDSLEWQRQYEAQQKKGSELERELQQAKQNSEQREQTLPDEPEKELVPPQSRVPVFALNIVRGASSSEPANQISIPRSASSVVLSLELESDPDVRSYRATISTADNRVVSVAKDLKPQSRDTLKVTVKSELMKPNDYQLALEGLTKEGSYVSQGKYYFRVKESSQ
ncbi:MAG TPA: hypothetical protein VJT71_16015 [Pyrinomonadaceae bacterium]|nr:hypothetical protein [Pyrinomonadaceae bacterium]